MEIKNIRNTQSFGTFFRNSPPCMNYLSKNFEGNGSRFKKALEVLDLRCSKHKYFDMFFSADNSSIRIFPKDKSVEKYLLNGKYMFLPQSEHYNEKVVPDVWDEMVQQRKNSTFIKRFLNLFSFKAKEIINPYYKLPSNVREAVDLIEKIERSI